MYKKESTKVISVDLDDVLAHTTSFLLNIVNEKSENKFSMDDINDFGLDNLVNSKGQRLSEKEKEEVKTKFYYGDVLKDVPIIIKNKEFFMKLGEKYSLILNTARNAESEFDCELVKQETIKWVLKHFGKNTFKEIEFTFDYNKLGHKGNKYEICKKYNAIVHIDDCFAETEIVRNKIDLMPVLLHAPQNKKYNNGIVIPYENHTTEAKLGLAIFKFRSNNRGFPIIRVFNFNKFELLLKIRETSNEYLRDNILDYKEKIKI